MLYENNAANRNNNAMVIRINGGIRILHVGMPNSNYSAFGKAISQKQRKRMCLSLSERLFEKIVERLAEHVFKHVCKSN